MDDDGIVLKIFNYLWVPVSFLPFFGGLAFIFAGWRVKYTRWIDEGIVYMIPFIFLTLKVLNDFVLALILIVWAWTIIRGVLLIKPYARKLNGMKKDDGKEMKTGISSQNMFIDDDEFKTGEYCAVTGTSYRMKINCAGWDELLSIPGFTPEISSTVLRLRERGVYITSDEDLRNLLNVNPENVAGYIDFSVNRVEKSRKLDL